MNLDFLLGFQILTANLHFKTLVIWTHQWNQKEIGRWHGVKVCWVATPKTLKIHQCQNQRCGRSTSFTTNGSSSSNIEAIQSIFGYIQIRLSSQASIKSGKVEIVYT